ncbi:hypothetical protein QWZ10_16485 [Paracoccus cavernae]|uniref:Uncharacterized protein n=1 Tax=Paracoccus cavernae TaxID=1571207 RepID=A0ABT8DAM8_9RHOB|nr:hypothetical protein [Paracoccus cavernae]
MTLPEDAVALAAAAPASTGRFGTVSVAEAAFFGLASEGRAASLAEFSGLVTVGSLISLGEIRPEI